MKSLWFIPLLVIGAQAAAANLSQENADLLESIEQQCRRRAFTESSECVQKLRKQYEREGKFRGTTAYAEKHYKSLDNKVLYELTQHLIEQRKTARDLGEAMLDRQEGELTKDKYEAEIEWAMAELKRRGYWQPNYKP